VPATTKEIYITMEQIYEIRVRWKNDTRGWEEIPPTTAYRPLSNEDLKAVISTLLLIDHVVKVRVNVRNSPQGYYYTDIRSLR